MSAATSPAPVYSVNTGHLYRPGTLAFFDTIQSGLVPCKVTSVSKGGPFPGWHATGRPEITAVVTADRGAYKKGMTVESPANYMVPRSHVFTPPGSVFYRVRTNYSWHD